jgi:predicted ABC-type ATPase
MAGSSGAGKTEFSKRLMEILKPMSIVRRDVDEIKEQIPQYTGKNSSLVQGTASIVADNLNFFTLKNKQNSIMDGTFSKYEKSKNNIELALKKQRKIAIFYIYQDPILAWDFMVKREKLEGRNISKNVFI